MIDPVFQIGPRVTALPIVHGSGDFAWEVRRWMTQNEFDCLAVPLPKSFQSEVERAVVQLPTPGVVLQREAPAWNATEPEDPSASYVPIDPCQGVVAAIREAIGEHRPRRFIDMETAKFEVNSASMPDPYALKTVSLQQFAASTLPFLSPPVTEQHRERIDHIAYQLRELSIDFRNILLVCSALDWPWIRQAFNNQGLQKPDSAQVSDTETFGIHLEGQSHHTLYFLLGELPFITGLYEKARSELASDDHLSIDGVKQLLLEARDAYRQEYRDRAKRVTPHLLGVTLKYIRNLSLLDRRLRPELVTIVTAAQQTVGDSFALQVLETAKQYPYPDRLDRPSLRMGIEEACLPSGDVVAMKSRLPGPPVQWQQICLIPKPDQQDRTRWQQRWNPMSQCSWPPEDVLIERFRSAVFDRAKQVMGADLAKTEKFTTSIKDGIDIRDTLRNWHENQIYVKVLPPSRGKLDAAIMLFDSPADPRDYPWRTTWFAEHNEESTLAFFATDYRQNAVGPGICQATYGGALFLFPPVMIPDIWTNPHLDFAATLEERVLAAACRYSRCPRIALLSPLPPGPAWRLLARRFKKTWVHLPLSQFGDSTVQQLRLVHVLNGKHVRSYAAKFVRQA